VELSATQIFRISSADKLPILVEDCARPEPLLEAQRQEIATIDKELEPLLEAFEKETDADKKKEIQAKIEPLNAKKSTAAVRTAKLPIRGALNE